MDGRALGPPRFISSEPLLASPSLSCCETFWCKNICGHTQSLQRAQSVQIHTPSVSWGIRHQQLHHTRWGMGWGPPAASFQRWSIWASGLSVDAADPQAGLSPRRVTTGQFLSASPPDRPLPGPRPPQLRHCLPPGPPRPPLCPQLRPKPGTAAGLQVSSGSAAK